MPFREWGSCNESLLALEYLERAYWAALDRLDRCRCQLSHDKEMIQSAKFTSRDCSPTPWWKPIVHLGVPEYMHRSTCSFFSATLRLLACNRKMQIFSRVQSNSESLWSSIPSHSFSFHSPHLVLMFSFILWSFALVVVDAFLQGISSQDTVYVLW